MSGVARLGLGAPGREDVHGDIDWPTHVEDMNTQRKQSEAERREHLQTLVLLGSLILQVSKRRQVQREFVVFSVVNAAAAAA